MINRWHLYFSSPEQILHLVAERLAVKLTDVCMILGTVISTPKIPNPIKA